MPDEIPTAVIRPARRVSLLWIIPVLALALAAGLAWRAWTLRGVAITIQFESGHGLREGDEVRYRGVTVGHVRGIDLSDDLASIVAEVALIEQGERIARAGTRFWIVRPQIGFERIAGIETLLGPRYIVVEPGDAQASPQREFVALPEPPLVESIDPGDLEIVLHASQRGPLRRGVPVAYRQVQIGTVMSVGLTSDGGAVEARVHIQRPYVSLIREQTRFWVSGGVRTSLGLTGVSIEAESIQSLLSGQVSLATPPPEQAGATVRTGHRFDMVDEPESDWLEWEPMTAIGSSYLPAGVSMPTPLRARLSWREGRVFVGDRSRHGWVIQTDRGLLGPADLLMRAEDAREESSSLEVAGRLVPLPDAPQWQRDGLALIDVNLNVPSMPVSRIRLTERPEDVLVVGDPGGPPMPLAAARFTVEKTRWAVDPAATFDEQSHGSAVIARSDGAMIGILLVEKSRGRVSLIDALPE